MLRPGERIGDWIVEARLGEGEHGAIFLARHGLNLNLRGALKVARPPDYEKARDNFIAEIEPLLVLRHEALIHVLGWGEDSERSLLWMTTELVRGRSLEERLQRGPFDLEEVGFVFGRLAGALALIHSHGAHHGDLRPTDVLLAEGRHIRITGFGTVFREGSQGQLDAESLAYVGPEYFDDPENCSPISADVYALGLILHEAITGKRVFPIDPALKPAPQMARIMGMKMRMGPLDPGDDVPLPLRRIVLQTTDPDPAARPPDLSGFLTALSMASRDYRDYLEAPSGSFPLAHDADTPEDHSSVRLSSSLLQKQQRPTPFPFAPPGWGPRAHRVPSPMSGLIRTEPPQDVLDAGQVRQVHVVERDPLPPPVADEPLYDEPEELAATDQWEEPEVSVEMPAADSPIPRSDAGPIPVEDEDEDEDEDEAVVVDDEEGVLIEAPPDESSVPMAEPALDVPVRQDQELSSMREERERQRRAFVPPPPVPDPTLVAPEASGEPESVAVEDEASRALPTDPSLVPEPVLGSPEPSPIEPPPTAQVPVPVPLGVEPSLVPPAPFVQDQDVMPSPVAPGAVDAAPAALVGPTLSPPEEPAPEPIVEPDEPPAATPQSAETEPPVEPAPAATHDYSSHVPVEESQPAEELQDDEDWSWHEDEETFAPDPSGLGRDDPYTRPIDQLYADDLDPSASDIAADVFGDHRTGTGWLKWPALVVVACVVILWLMFGNREQPVPEGSSQRPPPAEPVPAPPAPPPVEPEPDFVEAPELGLEEVVGTPDAIEPVEPVSEPQPAPSQPSTPTVSSRSSYQPASSAGSSGSRRSASLPSTAPTTAVPAYSPPVAPQPAAASEPAVAVVEPAVAEVAPAKGVMDHLRDGWASLDSGNLVGAQGAFMSAMSLESGNGMAHYGLGQVAERAHDYGSASYHYGRALGALGSNPTMRGELQAALQRVGAKSAASATPAPAAQPAATATEPAQDDAVEVTRKKRDELEESFRQELWDEDPDQ